MVVFLSILIGSIIMYIALLLIRKEVQKASFFKHVQINELNSKSDDQIVMHIQKLEQLIDDMNQSFYDIVNDLEGKYSVHEKEIELMDRDIKMVQHTLKDLTSLMSYQGKEILTIQKDQPDRHISKPKPVVQNDIKPKVLRPRTGHTNDDLKSEIMRLRALGYDEQQIARQLGKGVREIKMLMDFIK